MTEHAPNEFPEEAFLDEAGSDVAPEAMIRALQAMLNEKETELATMKDQALRALAEAEKSIVV